MKDINLQAIWNKHKLQRKNNSKNNIYKLHILTVKVGGNLKIYETPKTADFYTVIIFTVACAFLTAFSHSFIKYSCYLIHKSYKMVYNKSKTSLIRHIQEKYITHEDEV